MSYLLIRDVTDRAEEEIDQLQLLQVELQELFTYLRCYR